MKNLNIRFKMMLWYTLLTIIMLAFFIPILYTTISKSIYKDKENLLTTTMSNALLGIETDNNQISLNDSSNIPNNMPTVIKDKNDKIVFSNKNADWISSENFIEGSIKSVSHGGENWLLFDKSITNNGVQIGQIRIAYKIDAMYDTLSRIKIIIIVFVPLYLLISIIAGLLIAKKALAPITKITNAVKDIESKDLSKRIDDVTSKDEVGELARTFNNMLNRLENSFEKEKRFTSDASHELRTPISIINSYSEYLLHESQGQNNKSENGMNLDGDVCNAISIIYNENQKMNKIITQLLMITRGYDGKYKLELEMIDLNEIIDNIIDTFVNNFDLKGITIDKNIMGDSEIIADQSFDNSNDVKCY